MATTNPTTTQVRLSSLVRRRPQRRARKMRRYRLVFNYNEAKYNGGVEYDIETSTFYVPKAPPVIKELAKSLAPVSKAVVRVYCFDKGSQGEGVSATGFFIDPHHVLTTSDIIMGEDGKFMDANLFEFAFTLRISTKQFALVEPTLITATYISHTENLLLLRTSPIAGITPLAPFHDFFRSIEINDTNVEPEYLDATSIGVVGFCDAVTLLGALSDYNDLIDKQHIPPPLESDTQGLPVHHKSLFPGRLICRMQRDENQFGISASVYHGACGSPVFCAADPHKFLGVVLAGSDITNHNIILSVLSNEFTDILEVANKDVQRNA